MNKKYNVLVTGCGGDIGQSIGKILKSNPLFALTVGCDIHDEHPGKFIFDECVQIPSCSSEFYEPSLKNVIQQFKIDIIVPTSESELRLYAEQRLIDNFHGATLISANLTAMEVGFDKLLTANFLQGQNLPYPKTQIASEVKEPFLPLILKNRRGAGSKALFLIKEKDEFDFYVKKFPEFIAQEYIDNSKEEYTCGVFRTTGGDIRTITYKRKLLGGFSGFGIVVNDKTIDRLLNAIAEKLDLRGSINVQLRLSDRGPIVFEINPRFSSTVLFRHLMGFEDVIWSIQDRLGMNISAYHMPNAGKRFYKGFSEYID